MKRKLEKGTEKIRRELPVVKFGGAWSDDHWLHSTHIHSVLHSTHIHSVLHSTHIHSVMTLMTLGHSTKPRRRFFFMCGDLSKYVKSVSSCLHQYPDSKYSCCTVEEGI